LVSTLPTGYPEITDTVLLKPLATWTAFVPG